jgi:hypothetical protein
MRVLAAAVLAAIGLISSASARTWYCAPLSAYYPTIAACPAPWQQATSPREAEFDALLRHLEVQEEQRQLLTSRSDDGPNLYKCGGLPNLFDGMAKISERLNYMTSREILAVNERMIADLRAGVDRTDWAGPNIENRKCQFRTFIHHDMVENSIIRGMLRRGYSDRTIQDALRGTGW